MVTRVLKWSGDVNRRKKTRRARQKSPEQVAFEIRSELRAILEFRRDLYLPICDFEPAPPSKSGAPRFYVLFDKHPRVQFLAGLQLGGLKQLCVPDVRVQNSILDMALRVWHLRDRLDRYQKLTGKGSDVNVAVESSTSLRVCADLANWKKHGGHDCQSQLNPALSEVKYDTSNSGPVELYYDGAMKLKGLIVTNPVPIPFRVDVTSEEPPAELGDARELFNNALMDWLTVIRDLGLLSDDNPETKALRRIFLN